MPNRVLIADDQEEFRNMVSTELIDIGYEVQTAVDGEEAIAILEKNAFDLVLLDINMPKKDGLDVLKMIKENEPKTKVVMLTGFGDLKIALEAKRVGADDFVQKPYDLVELIRTIDRLVRSS